MTKTKKRMAVAAIAAAGCLAGVLGLRAPESESRSALTLANIEALTKGEVTIEYDKCCVEDTRELCLPNPMGLIAGRPVSC